MASCGAARQELDDEALARQLQAEEHAVTRNVMGNQPVTAYVVQPGYQPGMAMPISGQGVPVTGAVIQGVAVPMQVQGGPIVGQPYPMAYGMGQPGGMPYGGMAVVDPMTGAVAYAGQGPTLAEEELVVLNYRFSMTCFASIDVVFTALNVIAVIRDLMYPEEAASEEENQNGQFWQSRRDSNKTILGFEGLPPEVAKYIGLAGLIFLIGPVCGLIGARSFKRNMVLVYLVFCVGKMVFEIVMAALTPHWFLIIIAFIQIWITKIVLNFWKALAKIGEHRLRELMDPNILEGAPIRRMYW